MRKHRKFKSASIALVTAISVWMTSLAPYVAAQSSAAKPASAPPATAKPATTKPGTTTPPASQPASTTGAAQPVRPWPRSLDMASGARITVYEPQVSNWENNSKITLIAAVAYTSKSATTPALGTITVEATSRVALEDRLVDFSNFAITGSSFASLSRDQTRELINEIAVKIPPEGRVISLDTVLAAVDKSKIKPRNVDGVKADPPTVFFSKRPAVLVNVDGDPVWSNIPSNDLRYAVNTNWDLFEHGPTKTLYLRNEQGWLKATALAGPWTPAGTLPPSFSKLPADENWKEVKAALPGKPYTASNAPVVFTSTAPAEMILLTGEPNYVAVPNTALLWVENTESDLFRMGKTGAVYFLVAGRWFSAPDFTGPWTFVTPTLPEDFKRISLEHPRSRVLASVPGTEQAAEAVLLASIPQTARVNKKTIQAPEVDYQGQPQFEAIDKTTVQRAVNTDKDILKVGDLYYMCFQGIWFMSKSPNGPWQTADSVPKQIYEIPPSSSAHNVTYVTVVEDDDDDEWVTFATAAAYTGVMVAWGCAVWGSGWYYPPYVGYGGMYPVYYPHYPTYGYGAWYNPHTGAYGRRVTAYGPYGGAGVGARYNPRTGTYSRGAAAWGPYGARGAATAYNPRTGAVGATRQGSNVYGSWGSTAVQRGDQWANTTRYTNNRTGNTTRVTNTSGGGSAVSRNGPGGGGFVGQSGSGNVYAGQDGNVYRKNGDSWQQAGDGGWNDVQGPSAEQKQAAQDRAAQTKSDAGSRTQGANASPATMDKLERDASARSAADTGARARSSGSSSYGGSSSRSGSSGGYGGGGGARRSGGGRRR